MGFEFTINPVLYAVLIVLEMYGLQKMVQYLTGLEIDNKRIIKSVLIISLIIFLTDVFVFNFHKTGPRSMLLLFVLFVAFKLMYKHSLAKSAIQLFLLFVMTIIVDMCIQFAGYLIFKSSMNDLIDSFTVLYLINISAVYMVVLLCKVTKFKLIKLNKLSF
jgi:hypothetical protein